MSLINSSYFNVNLQVPQLQQKAVTDSLQVFIDKYEPEFLIGVLGYDLYLNFVAGLAEDPIDAKWLFLRDGGNFIGYNTYTHKWIGLAPSISIVPVISPNTEIPVYVGALNSPVSDTNTYTFPASRGFAGLGYYVERRGFGTMLSGIDISTNNGQTWTLLQPSDKFQEDELFVVHVTRLAAGSPAYSTQPSPLAAYVYYHYMRDLQTQSMGVGETKAVSQNAVSVSGAQKMVDAWNMMVKQIGELREYLNINNSEYAGWDYGSRTEWNYSLFAVNWMRTINTIGI